MNEPLLLAALVLCIVCFIAAWYMAAGPKAPPEKFLLDGPTDPRLFTSEDVDPIIAGGRYANVGNMRPVYTQRTAFGLREFASSSGAPGDSGVDVGPWGLYEYGGRSEGADDGIPEQWVMPSTPIRWYTPKNRDYYADGEFHADTKGAYMLTAPDHLPEVS